MEICHICADCVIFLKSAYKLNSYVRDRLLAIHIKMGYSGGVSLRSIVIGGRISKKGAFFIALKGLHIPAQGNALGNTLQ